VAQSVRIVGPSSGITKDRKSHHTVGTKGFICVDGEGINLPNGEHRYVLFGVGDNQIENENGLHWTDILDFLYKHYRRGYAFVGFYLGYDFDRWLCTMPEKKVERLITIEGRESRKSKSPNLHSRVLPVDMPNGWQINMLGKKMFEFRKRSCHCDIFYCKCPGKGPWMRICDAGPFFQSSFLKAIDPSTWKEPIVSHDEYELIKKGKENRADADHITDEMRYYNRLENRILARLMHVLNMGFQEMGIVLAPGQWFGPGQAAQKWLKKEKVTTAEQIQNVVPQWFLEAARMSYFGGWFEIMMHGIIPGESHEYDINSAYPYIIAKLPCLLHGAYKRGMGNYNRSDSTNTLVLLRARVSCYKNGRASGIGTMLHRDKSNRILRPTRTEGWFWLHEIRAARQAKLISHCHVYEWMSYDPCNCMPPMRNVSHLYDLRIKVGKDTPLGKGCRLAYNSMYGKFAQSVGNPVFANPIWASLITSGCRTMILEAIATHPKGKWHVAMVATDAVFFVTPHPTLPISKHLGEWDYTPRNRLTLFKPGVYWDDKTRMDISEGRSASFKARGISSADFSHCLSQIDSEFEQWSTNPPDLSDVPGMVAGWPNAKFITGFAMISCLQAIRRGKWFLAGQVSQSTELTQNANPYDKRIGAWPQILEDGRCIWRSEPWTFDRDNCQSKPYQKRFGMEDPWSLERLELYGINQDGTIPEILSEQLGLR
jgi:DNA polymerase family B